MYEPDWSQKHNKQNRPLSGRIASAPGYGRLSGEASEGMKKKRIIDIV